jgi:30S ribosomal protein S31
MMNLYLKKNTGILILGLGLGHEIAAQPSSAHAQPPTISTPWDSVGLSVVAQRARDIMAMMQWCGAVAKRVVTTQRPALTSSSSSGGVAPILCGRGDKKTKKGKRFKGSYGNARPKKEKMIERIKDKVEVPRSTPWPLPFKLI